MPRRAAATKRPVEADPVFRSKLVSQVINRVMQDGKKSKAEQIVYEALAILAERTGKEPVEALETSIKALTPVLEVRSRRVGGATYQVPVEVPAPRARTLAVRWLVEFSRSPSRAARTSARTTSSAWRRPTRPSLTIAGSRRARPARAPAGSGRRCRPRRRSMTRRP
jgi:small subunit ribosomal protein S7